MLLLINLFSGPVESIAVNAVESIRVIGCSLTLTFDHLKERAKLIMAPVVEVLSTSVKGDIHSIKGDLLEIQKMVSAIKDEAEFSRNHTDLLKISPKVSVNEEELQDDDFQVLSNIQEKLHIDRAKSEDIVNKTKELLRSSKLVVDSENFSIKASVDPKTLKQLLKANLSGSIEEFNVTKILYESCLSVFRGAKLQCDAAVGDMRQSCQDSFGSLLSTLFCSPVLLAIDTMCPWVLDQVIDEKSMCNTMQTSIANITVDPFNLTGGANINSVYKNLTQKLARMNEDIVTEEQGIVEAPERLELNISINDKTLRLLLKTRDLWRYITDKYRLRRALYQLLSFLYEVYTSITFLFILMQAIHYQRRFLKSVKFDNTYITGMFRTLDAKRRLARKEAVLPLTRDESERYITTFTCKRRTSEERRTQRASCTVILLFLVLAFSLLYIDDIFYSILSSIHEHALIKYRELGHHELQVNVTGEGPLARTVRRLANHFNSTYDLNKLSTTSQCLPQPQTTSSALYVQFLYLVIGYIFIDQMSIYAMRLRRVTMALLYPEKEEQRVAYLYNYILINRRRLKRDGLLTLNDDDDDDDDNNSPRDKEIFTIRDAIVYMKNCARDGICCGASRCFGTDNTVDRWSRDADKAIVYKMLSGSSKR